MRLWPFGKKQSKNVQGVPPELRTYYDTNTKHSGRAWVVGLISLVATLIILLSLFLAGRWIYRKVRHTDNTSPAVSQQQNESKANQSPQSPAPATNTSPVPAPNAATPTTPNNQATDLPRTGPDIDL